MTMETIEYVGSGGVTLMADVRGDPDANPILFMHGGGQTRHSWGGAAELLAERGWQTISIDLRGHGDSGWSEEGDYEAEHFAADINAVLATLGRKAVLVVRPSADGRRLSSSAAGCRTSAGRWSWSTSRRRSRRKVSSASWHS